MVSETAIESIEILKEKGLKPTVQDIVRLNALGLKVERAADGADLFAVPRCALMGSLVFRQKTLGHEFWIDRLSPAIDIEDPGTFLIVHAFALSRPHDDLPDPNNITAVTAAIDVFMHGEVSKFTLEQLRCAVYFALAGADHTVGELPHGKVAVDDPVPESVAAGIIHEGQAVGLGLSLADYYNMTMHDLRGVIDRALEFRGIDVSKTRQGRAFGEYCAALDEITARLQAEKESA